MSAILSKPLVALACLLSLISCNKHFDAPESPQTAFQSPNINIADIKHLSEQGYIDFDIVVGGRVTTSDSAQNFYKRCFIEDETGGIQIAINNYDIYSMYPPGDSVWVNLRGLTVGIKDGVKCIGYPTNSDYLEPISSIVILRKIMHSTGEERKRPTNITLFEGLTEGDIGRLVTVEARFSDTSTAIEPIMYEGVRELQDRDSCIAKLKSTQYCKFANQEVPRGWVLIRAIVVGQQDDGTFELMLSDTDDVRTLHTP